MYAHEKKREATKDERQMEEFRTVLAECDLIDLGYTGQKFTWERGNFDDTNIRERLDKGMANNEWLNLFIDYLVKHLPYSFSDHYPILIQMETNNSQAGRNRFKFESWWLLEPTYANVIKKLWDQKSGDALDKLEYLRVGLQKWGRNIKGERDRKTKNLRDQLVEPDGMNRDDDTLEKIIDKFWRIVGKEISDFCLEVLNKGKSLKPLNHTNIVLIPKAVHPKNPTNFRPISLCSVFYKIISKTIADRLQKVLNFCIDSAQSMFGLGRLITDNVLLAYESLHTLRNKRVGKKV
ncbi:reverse transcriptase [Gossypium australe]|uniref:Reverse transcriptase n=1 Tax=Gossypium australe TaxID=47621 RepID=A0A5B6WCY8_9ROSI|nr:reverse transcriptase [Gossypium australe]